MEELEQKNTSIQLKKKKWKGQTTESLTRTEEQKLFSLNDRIKQCLSQRDSGPGLWYDNQRANIRAPGGQTTCKVKGHRQNRTQRKTVGEHFPNLGLGPNLHSGSLVNPCNVKSGHLHQDPSIKLKEN